MKEEMKEETMESSWFESISDYEDETTFFNIQSGVESPQLPIQDDGDGTGLSAVSGESWVGISAAAAMTSLPHVAQPMMPQSPGLQADLALDASWARLHLPPMGEFQGNFVGAAANNSQTAQGLYAYQFPVSAANTSMMHQSGLSTPPSESHAVSISGHSFYPPHESFDAQATMVSSDGYHDQQRQDQHLSIFDGHTKSWLSSAVAAHFLPETAFSQSAALELMPVPVSGAPPMSSRLGTPSLSPHELHYSDGSPVDYASDGSDAASSPVATASVSSSGSNYNHGSVMATARARRAARRNTLALRRSSRTRLPSIAPAMLQGTTEQDHGASYSGIGIEAAGSNVSLPSGTTTTTTPRRRRTSFRFHYTQQQQPQQQNQNQPQQFASSLDAITNIWSSGVKPPGAPYQYVNQMDAESLEFFERTLLADRDDSLRVKVPFKMIQHKLRHVFCGAQETLRGHHRRLVKQPSQRVRKPVWHEVDVKLLRRAVDSPRCKFPNGKISWRAVSQYISSSGGTYDFGITTCSRKWNELTGGAPAGGAAVDDDEDDEDQ
ncbi:hypothetical protein PLICBS_003279 [Purpureocillium lilacinum]|uniref:uncharacterized protein n=1 Tax=Purpureocillium lilacinum TaxID=33203 RepID=UPI0020817A20|nr:hypothetical protein PLICBS_003279 [Purpureocillium lilacinum]